MTATRARTRTPAKGKPAGDGKTPLIIAVPGGQARFYSQDELTPRRTRALDVMLTHLGPRMRELAAATQVTDADGDGHTSAILDGPSVSISEEEAEKFAALNDLAAWVYLKSWTVKRDLPETVDDVLDLPTPLYKALVNHAAELVAESVSNGFAMPDDMDTADEDLPTSA